ncbi:hypothetical protein [uncultured Kordia sp.]|uniref:hypothetical protein n=1 Tax=uncultured Kordia sp. TaxID=507699 RepID=UPI00262E51E5|nr:hypothetical protein [uncultured Kordia sp.]
MKSYTYLKLFFISSLSFILMAGSCSNDDDDITPETETFMPVTINLDGLGIDVDDTSFTTQGFDFTVFRVRSTDAYINNGILLAFPQDGNPSTMELDLSDVSGISKITIPLFNNCANGCTVIQVLNNNEVIQLLNTNDVIPQGEAQAIINLSPNQAITRLKMSSFETTFYSITIE